MTQPLIPARPVIFIVMGVSGSGKSTLAKNLAKSHGFAFIEADDYHTPEAKALMASGTPLTDAHREPWITALCQTLVQKAQAGTSCVLAYSGLRRLHRQRFRELGFAVQFLHLEGEKALIQSRMASRKQHFMPATLLDSQFASLEPTQQEADIIPVSVHQPIAQIVQQAESLLNQFIQTQAC